MAGIKVSIKEFFFQQIQGLSKNWTDFRGWLRESWLNWLCEAGLHQGDPLTADHDHKPHTTVKYCSRCSGIIEEVEHEKGMNWTSETP